NGGYWCTTQNLSVDRVNFASQIRSERRQVEAKQGAVWITGAPDLPVRKVYSGSLLGNPIFFQRVVPQPLAACVLAGRFVGHALVIRNAALRAVVVGGVGDGDVDNQYVVVEWRRNAGKETGATCADVVHRR